MLIGNLGRFYIGGFRADQLNGEGYLFLGKQNIIFANFERNFVNGFFVVLNAGNILVGNFSKKEQKIYGNIFIYF